MNTKIPDPRFAPTLQNSRVRPSRRRQRACDRRAADQNRQAADQNRQAKSAARLGVPCTPAQDKPEPTSNLLPRLAANQPGAFRELVDRYGGLVRSLAHNFTRESADIDDAAQEVFLALWKNASKYDPAKSPESAFVSLIARRRLIDLYRRQKRRLETVDDEPEFESLADRRARDAEIQVEAKLTAPVLDQLRSREREALLMSVCLGMSHSEIARHVNRPLGTVKTHIRRGLQRIREALEAAEPAAEKDRHPTDSPDAR